MGLLNHVIRMGCAVTVTLAMTTVISTSAFASGSSSDSGFKIEEAKWDDEKGRIKVKGEARSDFAVVELFDAESGAKFATVRADDEGDFEYKEYHPAAIPCRVRAESEGRSDEKSVEHADDFPGGCGIDGGGNQPPVADPGGPYNGTVNIALVFDANGSNDPDGTIIRYDWDFGDGTQAADAGPTPSHTYTEIRVFTVRLSVTDNDGDSGTATTTANITDGQTPPTGNVSINSTSQSCDTADISGNGVACNNTPVAGQPFTGNNADHTIIAINDLGMHCGDLDTRISSILPPFQVLLAQVILKGAEPTILSPNQVDVFYSAVSNPNDPILGDNSVFRGLTADGSVYKTNFWDYAVPGGTYDDFYPAFNPFDPTVTLTPLSGPPFNITYDVGLPVPNVENLYLGPNGIYKDGDEFLSAALQDMPGIAAPYAVASPLSNEPQRIEEHLGDKPFFADFPFGYIANDVNWHEGAGIPFSAYDDAGRENAYPLVRVQATTDGNPPNGSNVKASLDTVLPISGEASCKNCHADPMDPNFGGSRTSDPTDELEAGPNPLPVVDSSEDPLFVAGNVPVDVAIEWATDINVLRLHDKKHGANYPDFCDGSVAPCPLDPCIINTANPNGSSSCLTNQALVQQKPVVCQVCHYTPALDLAQLGPLAGPPGTVPNGRNQVAMQSNSRVMHNHHGQFTSLFPSIDPPVQDGNGGISNQATRLAQMEDTCYQCHPGTNVQCLRGAMFDGGMLCSDCHGDMKQVGADFTAGVSPQNPGDFKLGLGNFYEPGSNQPRVPWANEPGCGSCHTGDHGDNLANQAGVITNLVDTMGNDDNIRLRQAWHVGDTKATPIVPTNTRFAENPIPASFNGFSNPGAGTISSGAANPKLYRVSTGHGGVFCEGCHGATHAEYDTDAPSLSNDDVASTQLQGHTGTIVECSTCHGNTMNNRDTLDGPHGMHPVGDNTGFADGGHEDLAEDNLAACEACHGPGGRKDNSVGTVLSLAKADRNFNGLEDGGRVTKGTPVGCTTCHD